MIKILAYLFFQSFFIGRNVYPCEFISVSHDRADISVSQIKDPFDDILFYFLYLTVFSPFSDNRFNLIFGDFPFFIGIYA